MGLIGKLFGKSDSDPENPYHRLRQQLLQIRASDLGLAESAERPIYGVVMETGTDGSVATFVCLADGTVSLYLSTGGGVIGAGKHESVRSAADELLGITNEYAEGFIGLCSPGLRRSLPANGRVHFYLLTYSGVYSADCSEEELAARMDPFAALFGNCHVVISEVRQIEEDRSP